MNRLQALRSRLPGAENPPIVLEIDLSRGLLDAPPADPLTALRSMHVAALADVVSGLRRGAEDDRVAGAVVLVSGTITLAQADELGAALAAFTAAGKTTIAWSESYGELGPGTVPYYLASHCGEVWMQPSGSVVATGLSLEITLVRGLLDKIGAEPQIGQRHEYKSAADLFLRTEVSEPHREMMQRLSDSVTEQLRRSMRERRGLSDAEVDAALDGAPVQAEDAVTERLVDRLGYRDDVYAYLEEALGRDGEVTLQYAHRYARHQAARPAEQLRARRKPAVAVVDVRGGISTGRSRPGSPGAGPRAGSATVCAALRAASRDEDVRAVVLHVDSPGGSYVASDSVRAAVHAVRATGRPVVASMGALAASGGYYVSMPCDRIVALPGTLTGSIGVLGGKLVLAETFGRLGVTRAVVESGQHSGMFSTVRSFDPTEWDRVNAWLDDVYEDFTQKAAADRGLDLSALEPMARGRVWTGADARDRGLVDDLGGLQRGIEVAAELAGLSRDEVRPARYPHLRPLDRLRPAESSEAPAAAAATWTYPAGGLAAWLRELDGTGPGVLSVPWRLRVV